MSAWSLLKQTLNTKKYIARTKLVKKVEKNSMVYHGVIYDYLDILTKIGYINLTYHYISDHGASILSYKLLRKIPEKLTIADAKKMKRMPWLSWFKYPE